MKLMSLIQSLGPKKGSSEMAGVLKTLASAATIQRAVRLLVLIAIVLGLTKRADALIKEPENLIWGNVVVGGKIITAVDTDIVIEARKSLDGQTLASYRMGSSAAAGDLYSLAIPLESVNPIDNPLTTRTGETIIVMVHNGQFVRYVTLYTVGERGKLMRLDLGDVDNDNNGLVDNWERQYFGAAGQDPNGDPDRDGVGNRNEMLGGTNPTFPDSRHPADVGPTNSVITIHEVAKYALAWKTGQPWPVAPTNIPVDFVARAGYLWKNGESYKLDTNLITAGAPLWWTNTVSGASNQLQSLVENEKRSNRDAQLLGVSLPTSHVVRTIESNSAQTAVAVTLAVLPTDQVSAYVVEETIPEGWQVKAISEEGAFDAASRRIRWGLFFDHNERTLSYQLELILGAKASGQISGVGSFDGWNVTTEGTHRLNTPGDFELQTPAFLADGNVSLKLSGEPGAQYEIQVSTDLVTWTVLTIGNAKADGSVEFTDNGAAATPRFYRARRLDDSSSNNGAR